VARFEFFRDTGGKKIWSLVSAPRRNSFCAAVCHGPKAATSDYEPVPVGFPGLAAPVERIYPCLAPFLELEDGRTIAAVDGADEIKPAADGMSVMAVWKRWVVAGARAGEWADEGIVSEVTWSLEGKTLQRVETLTASKALKVRRLWLAVPSRYDRLETTEVNGRRADRLASNSGALDVQVKRSDWPVQIPRLPPVTVPWGEVIEGLFRCI